ncbi:hypothetical protein EUX98_g7691 [Antrodiella citrinella]|uniref:OPT family small oligopeptide transporter n=1 Tax=Antrodiella citrinella TaxID=2447956 RepID=A0A4S4MMK6_9APHY|nr:hypothetical protein EUX98_g7691 [Antrodiella citrinella]
MSLAYDTAVQALPHESLKKLDSNEDKLDEKVVVDVDVKDVADSVTDSAIDEEEIDVKVIRNEADVAVEIISVEDDPSLPVFTFRVVFLGIGLSVFSSVLATIYTFKPQNATVSQLFCLIIAYVLGTAMASLIPTKGYWRYLNPGPFNIKEHTTIVIMASTASSVAIAMEVIAALGTFFCHKFASVSVSECTCFADLFYDVHLNAAVAIFQIFASQMLGYGIAGLLRTLLVYPTYAFYPTYISVVTLLQSLHFGGVLNHKRRRFFWIVFAAIFLWEWIPQYPFPLLTAISVICLADNGRHDFVRNLFGAGSSNEGLGLLSFSTSWTLITQGNPLVWPLRTQINSYLGLAIGYLVLTVSYYKNSFNGRDLVFMSTSLFSNDGGTYNQSAILTPDNELDPSKLAQVGLPRYTTTYIISQMCYNFSLGAAIVHVMLWHYKELKTAFGGLKFLKGDKEIVDPHYKQMQKYPEVPQWWYLLLLVLSLAVGIGCSYTTGTALLPWWSIILFTVISFFIAVCLGFITATTGFQISIKYAIQVMAAFIHPGKPIAVIATFSAQMAGSIIGSIFNYTMMITIVANNRAVLLDPVGTRVWSGWIVQQYNSGSVAMGALGKELFTWDKPYGMVPFAIFLGLFFPIPFWLVHHFSPKGSLVAKIAAYINTPIIALYVGWLPYSVNGQWWSCVLIGIASQWWARTRRPRWFKSNNYLLSAALDGGSQVILFILSFAVFGASNKAVAFPNWWGNSGTLSVDRCKST